MGHSSCRKRLSPLHSGSFKVHETLESWLLTIAPVSPAYFQFSQVPTLFLTRLFRSCLGILLWVS